MKKNPVQYGLFLALVVLSIAAGGLLCAAGPAHANDLTEAGDVLQIALPVTAFLSTYLYDDPEGRAQFSKAFLTSWGTVYGIKSSATRCGPVISTRKRRATSPSPRATPWVPLPALRFYSPVMAGSGGFRPISWPG